MVIEYGKDNVREYGSCKANQDNESNEDNDGDNVNTRMERRHFNNRILVNSRNKN